MPTNNGKITAPVSIQDVRTTLGASSLELGTLCTHANINWKAAHKPFEVPSKVVSILSEDTIIKYGYGLKAFTFKGTFENFKTQMATKMQDANWVTMFGLTYTKPSTAYRLTDFDKYCHTAELDTSVTISGSYLGFTSSATGDIIDAVTGTITDRTVAAPNWALLNAGTVKRSVDNANILDIMASTIYGITNASLSNLSKQRRGVLVMTPTFSGYRYALGTVSSGSNPAGGITIPWTKWLTESSSASNSLTDVDSPNSENRYPVIDFFTDYAGTVDAIKSTTTANFYVMYPLYQKIILDFTIQATPSKVNNKYFDIVLKLNGSKNGRNLYFSDLTNPKIYIVAVNGGSEDIITGTTISLSAINANQYSYAYTPSSDNFGYTGTIKGYFVCYRPNQTSVELRRISWTWT